MTVFHWLGKKIFSVFFALSVVECIAPNSMWECPDSRNVWSVISMLSIVRTAWWKAAAKWFLFCPDQVSEYRMTCFTVCGKYERFSIRQWLPRMTLSGPMSHSREGIHLVYQPRKRQISCIQRVFSCSNLCNGRTWCLENSLHVKCCHMKT